MVKKKLKEWTCKTCLIKFERYCSGKKDPQYCSLQCSGLSLSGVLKKAHAESKQKNIPQQDKDHITFLFVKNNVPESKRWGKIILLRFAEHAVILGLYSWLCK